MAFLASPYAFAGGRDPRRRQPPFPVPGRVLTRPTGGGLPPLPDGNAYVTYTAPDGTIYFVTYTAPDGTIYFIPRSQVAA